MLFRLSTLSKIFGACLSQSVVGSGRLQSVGRDPALPVRSFLHQITRHHPALLLLNTMNTEKSKSIEGKTAATKSPSKRNKSCFSQDEGTLRGSMRNKNSTSRDDNTRRGSQRHKGYAAQDEDTKSVSMRSKSSTTKDEDTKSVSMRSKSSTTKDEDTKSASRRNKSCTFKDDDTRSAVVKTQICDSHNKCTEALGTFSKRTLISSENKHIVTRSVAVKSKIISTRKECIDRSMKETVIDSQSEHSTTRSASMKSQTRGYCNEHSTTRSALMKSQIHNCIEESISNKSATIKSIICDLQKDTITTQGQTTKRTTRGSPRKGTVIKETPSQRKHRGFESGAGCASASNMNHKPGHVPVRNKEDSRTCSITQEHSQLEEGEIIDGESSPHTRQPGGRKRRRRSYKSLSNASTPPRTPKTCTDKVEVVDLQSEGYTFRDGRRGPKLMQHRSAGGGRQQTANTPLGDVPLKNKEYSRTCSVTQEHSQLEEGEIIDGESSPHTRYPGGRKRRRRSYKSLSNASTPPRTPKTCTDKVEVVDLQSEGYTFRDGRGGPKLMQHRSAGGGRQQTANTPSSIDTSSAIACIQTPKVGTCKRGTVRRSKAGDMTRLTVAPGDQCAAAVVALEEGEIRSDSDVPGNVSTIEMLPQSGSDMSISSEDGALEESAPTTGHTDSSHVFTEGQGLQGSSDKEHIPITSRAAHPTGSSLDPLATAFVPRGSASAVSDLAQHPNTADTSELPQMSTHPHSQPWSTFIAQSHVAQPESQVTSMTLAGGQTSSRRILLRPASDHSCPEMRNSSRCWQAVGHTDVQAGSMELTVMSYNILSQQLMDRHMYLYDRCRRTDLEWSNRGAALLTQIIAHNADIVCLQEVEHDDWVRDIRDTLAEHGYSGVHKKQSGDNTHGCAILFKGSKLLQLKAVPVEYMKGGILDRHNVGLILLLQPRPEVYAGSTHKICVATTHLLFNPRRGDVKLAQLMVLLAEIDKHAYLDDQANIGQCMQTGRKSCPGSDPDQVEPSHTGHGGHSSEIDKGAGCKCEPALQTSARPRPARYCPVVLCGDFNSEPLCDLYKFITTGFLKYDNCISRLLCGQEEGKWSGTDRLVDRELVPEGLDICESCQYLHVLMDRQTRAAADGGQPIPRVNSGRVWHSMNFKSVYSHFVGNGHQNREITTHHNNCSCTVDYIFYSQSAASCSQSLMPGSESGGSTLTRLDDSSCQLDRQTNVGSIDIQPRVMAAGSADIHKDREACQQPLELVARYTLLTRNELTRFGYMPNSVFPSDHLCLIARFLLR